MKTLHACLPSSISENLQVVHTPGFLALDPSTGGPVVRDGQVDRVSEHLGIEVGDLEGIDDLCSHQGRPLPAQQELLSIELLVI